MIKLPEKLLICRVPHNWYELIRANYITNGSAKVNVWYPSGAEHEDFSVAEPGTPALFVLTDPNEREFIAGGGFFQRTEEMPLQKAWNLYGVRNGVMDFEDFKARNRALGGKDEDPIVCSVISGTFIFARTDAVYIPDEFQESFKTYERKELPMNEPICKYLSKVALQRRNPELQEGRSENDWPGIYVMASQRNSFSLSSLFQTRMMKLYDFKCAITGCTSRPVLDVAHIKTMFDDNFQSENNGIVMRTDLHRLFSQGYMTAFYNDKGEVELEVSDTLKDECADEYLKYQGTILSLPEDKIYWPSREYLEWHRKIRFENWLRFGAIRPVGQYKAKFVS